MIKRRMPPINPVMNSAIDIDALENIVASYFKEQIANDEALAMDGKTLYGTILKAAKRVVNMG